METMGKGELWRLGYMTGAQIPKEKSNRSNYYKSKRHQGYLTVIVITARWLSWCWYAIG